MTSTRRKKKTVDNNDPLAAFAPVKRTRPASRRVSNNGNNNILFYLYK